MRPPDNLPKSVTGFPTRVRDPSEDDVIAIDFPRVALRECHGIGLTCAGPGESRALGLAGGEVAAGQQFEPGGIEIRHNGLSVGEEERGQRLAVDPIRAPGAPEVLRPGDGIELGEDTVPDESTILRFRHLLEEHDLTKAIFEEVRSLLEEKRLLLKQGTIVDATIIAAPSSTKNSSQSRDPEMKQTKKGNVWHFGMKIHVGTDTRGVVHSLTATHAAEADVNQLPNLVHGEERELYGDRAYWNEADRRSFQEVGVRYRVNRRGHARRPLTERWQQINRSRSRVRARGEHPFRVVKVQWGFRKTRYRGLAKNTARAYTAFALANLYLVRRRLLPPGVSCHL